VTVSEGALISASACLMAPSLSGRTTAVTILISEPASSPPSARGVLDRVSGVDDRGAAVGRDVRLTELGVRLDAVLADVEPVALVFGGDAGLTESLERAEHHGGRDDRPRGDDDDADHLRDEHVDREAVDADERQREHTDDARGAVHREDRAHVVDLHLVRDELEHERELEAADERDQDGAPTKWPGSRSR